MGHDGQITPPLHFVSHADVNFYTDALNDIANQMAMRGHVKFEKIFTGLPEFLWKMTKLANSYPGIIQYYHGVMEAGCTTEVHLIINSSREHESFLREQINTLEAGKFN